MNISHEFTENFDNIFTPRLSLPKTPVLLAHMLLPLPPVLLDLGGRAVHGEDDDALLPTPGLLLFALHHDGLVDPLNLPEPDHVLVQFLLGLLVLIGELDVLDHPLADGVIVLLDQSLQLQDQLVSSRISSLHQRKWG